MLDECKRLGFKTNNTNINEIKFDKKYDFIFAWHVLEHIKDFPSLVKKIKQNLDGKLILEVPTNNISRLSKKREWDGHSHYFSQKSFNLYFTFCPEFCSITLQQKLNSWRSNGRQH